MKNLFTKHKSTILTGVSVAGILATGVTAIKAGSKASTIINDIQNRGEVLKGKDKLKATWRCYIPPVTFGLATIVSILYTAKTNKQKLNSLNSALYLTSSTFNQYKDKIKTVYGEEAHQNIVNAIVAEKVEDDHMIYSPGFCDANSLGFEVEDYNTSYIFYLACADTFFESTINNVIEAEYHFNRNFILRGYNTLGNLKELLGLETTEEDYNVGWYIYDELYWVDFNHYISSPGRLHTKTKYTNKILVIDTVYEPTDEYIDECL